MDEKTIASFGDEWSRFDQSGLNAEEHAVIFDQYFGLFPWQSLSADAEGFDMGCGSGRWAKLVSPRVGILNCIDASADALAVAGRNLKGLANVRFIHSAANGGPLPKASQDFGYSLGVLHHIPDTQLAMAACTAMLKPGAPFLVYLYYRFDNRPFWFQLIWRASELLRAVVNRLPPRLKHMSSDLMAALIYFPLARFAGICEKMGLNVGNFPLTAYRKLSFYTMRTDSRDRFGTPLEQRFTRVEIRQMMEKSGLENIAFSDPETGPFWCAIGTKSR